MGRVGFEAWLHVGTVHGWPCRTRRIEIKGDRDAALEGTGGYWRVRNERVFSFGCWSGGDVVGEIGEGSGILQSTYFLC